MIKRVFPVLALAMFASTLGFGIISPLLPIYAESLGATGIWVGIIFGAYASFKHYKSLPGADLMFIGFLLYGFYALLAFTGPGFTESYFSYFSKIGKLNSENYIFFVSFALRLGLVLVVIGLVRVARGLRA